MSNNSLLRSIGDRGRIENPDRQFAEAELYSDPYQLFNNAHPKLFRNAGVERAAHRTDQNRITAMH